MLDPISRVNMAILTKLHDSSFIFLLFFFYSYIGFLGLRVNISSFRRLCINSGQFFLSFALFVPIPNRSDKKVKNKNFFSYERIRQQKMKQDFFLRLQNYVSLLARSFIHRQVRSSSQFSRSSQHKCHDLHQAWCPWWGCPW